MADCDIHIKGGTIVDGTRAPRYTADVWIRDGKIAQIGGQAPGFAKRVIDADGLLQTNPEEGGESIGTLDRKHGHCRRH